MVTISVINMLRKKDKIYLNKSLADRKLFLEPVSNLLYMTNGTDHYGSDRCVSMPDEGLT